MVLINGAVCKNLKFIKNDSIVNSYEVVMNLCVCIVL